MKLYVYEQIADVLITSGLKGDDLRTALDAINEMIPVASIESCDGGIVKVTFVDTEKEE